jgi:hypothetical protein
LDLDLQPSAIGDPDDAAATAETRAAMSGLTTIAFEPGTTSTAAIIDDVLSSVQSIAPLLKLPKTSTGQDYLDAARKNGVRRVPPILLGLLQPQGAPGGPQSVPTMRVAIMQGRGSIRR